MALVVETGSGSSTAESYLSVADADIYWTNRGSPTTWDSATTAEKEQALRIGTQYLDAKYHLRWLGSRSNEDQALDWPRSNVEDRDGYWIDSDSIPQALKNALAEAAYRHLLETNGLMPDVGTPGITQESVTVGPISKSTSYSGTKSGLKRFSLVEALLKGLITATGRVDRG